MPPPAMYDGCSALSLKPFANATFTQRPSPPNSRSTPMPQLSSFH